MTRHLGKCSSQSLGVFILVGLSCHTPHVAHDNFDDEIFLCFYGSCHTPHVAHDNFEDEIFLCFYG